MKASFYKYFKKTIFFVSLFGSFQACDDNIVLKENYDFETKSWAIKNVPSFDFEIIDTNVRYNIYYNLRNNLSYPFYNLYLKCFLMDSSGKEVSKKLDELILINPKTGNPYGDGIGDIYSHKIIAFKNYHFPKSGKYKIKLKQYMRQNPLQDILSVGITIEKKEQ